MAAEDDLPQVRFLGLGRGLGFEVVGHHVLQQLLFHGLHPGLRATGVLINGTPSKSGFWHPLTELKSAGRRPGGRQLWGPEGNESCVRSPPEIHIACRCEYQAGFLPLSQQSTAKPSSVPTASIYLGLQLPAASSGQPGALRRRANTDPHMGSSPPIWPCSGRGLASRCVATPTGACENTQLVRSYRTISPLPAIALVTAGCVVSVPLPVGSPRRRGGRPEIALGADPQAAWGN